MIVVESGPKEGTDPSPLEIMRGLTPTMEAIVRDFLPQSKARAEFGFYLERAATYTPQGALADTLIARAVDDEGLIHLTFSGFTDQDAISISGVGFGAKELPIDRSKDVTDYYAAIAQQCGVDPALIGLTGLNDLTSPGQQI